MKTEVIGKIIAYGKTRYRVSSTGKWQVLMFGCWPDGNGTPRYRWAPIPGDKVPEPVKREGGM